MGKITRQELSESLKGEIDKSKNEAEENNSKIENHKNNTSNPHQVSKADVGLSNVDNLSAASIRNGTTKADVGLSNVDNLSAASIRNGTTKADVGLSSVDNYSREHYDSRYVTAALATTMSGNLVMRKAIDYTTYRGRNITMGTSDTPPSGGGNGDIYFQYE